jgi:phosphoglycerate dehydrogenase-like enzyme
MPATAAPVVLVEGPVSDDQLEEIRRAAPAARCERVTRGELGDRIEEAEVVAGHVGPVELARAPNLRWIHTWSAGVDNALFPELVASEVVMTCSKSNGAVPLAEHAMLLMLMLNRDAVRWIRAQDERRWDHFVHGELAGQTCGIIGLGYSGADLAIKAKAFHMRVLGMRRSQEPVPGVDALYPRERLHEFLGESDVVVITAPRTPETQGMIGEAELRAMKDTAFLVTFSRGGIVDDEALLRALREGWIAGAGLDVHGQEPLPEDSPFWTAPHAIVTPHNGASTRATRQRAIDIFVDNLRRFCDGEELRNVVDKQAGY